MRAIVALTVSVWRVSLALASLRAFLRPSVLALSVMAICPPVCVRPGRRAGQTSREFAARQEFCMLLCIFSSARVRVSYFLFQSRARGDV